MPIFTYIGGQLGDVSLIEGIHFMYLTVVLLHTKNFCLGADSKGKFLKITNIPIPSSLCLPK